ncbi:MAG: phage protein GemA/Gp16 family protein [Pseudodonghicola sp.]
MTAALKTQIILGCKQLGIDADTRHDLQLVVTGKASLTDMTEAELQQVLDRLKAQGFAPVSRRGKRPAAKRADVRYCHVLWRLLHEAGVVEVGGAKGLNAFLRARFGRHWGAEPIDIDTMRDWRKISDIIEALKDMCHRKGISTTRGRK